MIVFQFLDQQLFIELVVDAGDASVQQNQLLGFEEGVTVFYFQQSGQPLVDGLAVEVVQHLLGEVGLGESEDDLGIGLGTSLGFW